MLLRLFSIFIAAFLLIVVVADKSTQIKRPPSSHHYHEGRQRFVDEDRSYELHRRHVLERREVAPGDDDNDHHHNDAELDAPSKDEIAHYEQQLKKQDEDRRKKVSAQMYTKFEGWKSDHKRSYDNHEAEQRHFGQFVSNWKFIVEHQRRYQRGLETFDMDVNRFSDWSRDEVKSKMNGFRPKKRHVLKQGNGHVDNRLQFQVDIRRGAPEAVDWRDNAVTSVKDQGNCGCCWAFSTTGAVEGQYYLKTNKLVSLSEQNLIDCSGKYGNDGCDGGIMDDAFQYISDNGIDTESDYPFEAKNDTCRFRRQSALKAKVDGYVDIPSGDEEALMEAVAYHGPVSAAIDASHQSLHFYTKGIYSEPRCHNNTDGLDHAILVVGYGVDQKTGRKYWTVKNSWGSKWGENGFFRIARNHNNMCGIATMASFPKLSEKSVSEVVAKSQK